MYKLALKMLFLHWKTHELPGAFPHVLPVGFAPEPLAPGLVKGPLGPTSQGLCALRPSIFCKLQKCFLINEAPAIPCPRAPSSKVTPLWKRTVIATSGNHIHVDSLEQFISYFDLHYRDCLPFWFPKCSFPYKPTWIEWKINSAINWNALTKWQP